MPTYTDAIPVTSSVPSCYVTVSEADSFLSKKQRTTIWFETDSGSKFQSLIEATQAIDNLDFVGDKTDSEQLTEFPRGGDTDVPENIKRACILIAERLNRGISIENTVDQLSKTAEGSMGSRDQFNRWFLPENLKAGIPSIVAWGLLVPYLRDPKELILSRTS